VKSGAPEGYAVSAPLGKDREVYSRYYITINQVNNISLLYTETGGNVTTGAMTFS